MIKALAHAADGRKIALLGITARRADREQIALLYIRICCDSGFRMDTARVSQFVAKALDIHPLEIWLALGMDDMDRIANGTHPCLDNPKYAAATMNRRPVGKAALQEASAERAEGERARPTPSPES